MPRISGVDIPANKKVEFALQYIHGIGPFMAQRLCRECNIDPTIRASELKDDQLLTLATTLDKKYVIEGQLRRQVAANIQRLRKINAYRGQRHAKGLPARGQRTRTNARTRKGPRKTIAVKRSVKEL